MIKIRGTASTLWRAALIGPSSFGGGELPDVANSAEAPLAAMKFGHRGPQIVGAEIRP
jgi:hypothetical protein